MTSVFVASTCPGRGGESARGRKKHDHLRESVVKAFEVIGDRLPKTPVYELVAELTYAAHVARARPTLRAPIGEGIEERHVDDLRRSSTRVSMARSVSSEDVGSRGMTHR